ncbi:hypothetical protein R1flu_014332 [Riccia fluitans]|uniref:SMP domain-containing protein n=1 Tax=Riccia fluitans TaxID=41844 RepID=A0ABD1YG67_9MARC
MSSAQETRPASTAAGMDQDAVVITQETTIIENTTETIVFGNLDEAAITQGVPETRVFTDKNGGSLDETTGPVTIGEALENVASKIGEKPLTASDARAIQAAEARATGVPTGVRGGPGAAALSAVSSATGEADVTIGDVLADAKAHLSQDKVVTSRDAAKVHSVEARNNDGRVEKGGVASTMQQAAAHNENFGSV